RRSALAPSQRREGRGGCGTQLPCPRGGSECVTGGGLLAGSLAERVPVVSRGDLFGQVLLPSVRAAGGRRSPFEHPRGSVRSRTTTDWSSLPPTSRSPSRASPRWPASALRSSVR